MSLIVKIEKMRLLPLWKSAVDVSIAATQVRRELWLPLVAQAASAAKARSSRAHWACRHRRQRLLVQRLTDNGRVTSRLRSVGETVRREKVLDFSG